MFAWVAELLPSSELSGKPHALGSQYCENEYIPGWNLLSVSQCLCIFKALEGRMWGWSALYLLLAIQRFSTIKFLLQQLEIIKEKARMQRAVLNNMISPFSGFMSWVLSWQYILKSKEEEWNCSSGFIFIYFGSAFKCSINLMHQGWHLKKRKVRVGRRNILITTFLPLYSVMFTLTEYLIFTCQLKLNKGSKKICPVLHFSNKWIIFVSWDIFKISLCFIAKYSPSTWFFGAYLLIGTRKKWSYKE